MDSDQLSQILEKDGEKPVISAKRFLLKTLMWLPICFVGWYTLASIFSYPAIQLSDLLLSLIISSIFEGVEGAGYAVDIITHLEITVADGRTGQVTYGFNALKYGYGYPLLLAMMFATPYSIYHKLDDITYGLILVVLAQTWGIIFESLTSLLLKMGGEVTQQATEQLPILGNEFFVNFIALGYQLGVLVLPALVPIAYWIMRYPDLLETLAGTKD